MKGYVGDRIEIIQCPFLTDRPFKSQISYKCKNNLRKVLERTHLISRSSK